MPSSYRQLPPFAEFDFGAIWGRRLTGARYARTLEAMDVRLRERRGAQLK